jgi:hypothetical protein
LGVEPNTIYCRLCREMRKKDATARRVVRWEKVADYLLRDSQDASEKWEERVSRRQKTKWGKLDGQKKRCKFEECWRRGPERGTNFAPDESCHKSCLWKWARTGVF